MTKNNMTGRWIVTDEDDDSPDFVRIIDETSGLSKKALEALRSYHQSIEDDLSREDQHKNPDERLPKNGPTSRYCFRWENQTLDFSNATLRYLLVEALWDNDSNKPYADQKISDVTEHVWGDDNLKCDQRLNNLCHMVRIAFRDAAIPLNIRKAGGKLWLEEIK